jgi:hypothetical protein
MSQIPVGAFVGKVRRVIADGTNIATATGKNAAPARVTVSQEAPDYSNGEINGEDIPNPDMGFFKKDFSRRGNAKNFGVEENKSDSHKA